MFANRLKEANVPVEVNETKQTMHGFDNQKCKITETAIKRRINALKTLK